MNYLKFLCLDYSNFMPLCARAEHFFTEEPSFLPLDSPAKPLFVYIKKYIFSIK